MPSFNTRIFRALTKFAQDYRFEPAYEASSQSFASLVRRESAYLCSYIFVRNELPGGAQYRIDYWLAPIDFPADGLDALSIGYKLRIAETFEDDIAFVERAAQKVERLSPALPSLCTVIEDELHNPVFSTPRFAKYHLETGAYNALYSEQSPFASITASSRHLAKALIQRTARYRDVEAATTQMVSELVSSQQLPMELEDPYFNRDARFIGVVLTKRLYIETLVPYQAG